MNAVCFGCILVKYEIEWNLSGYIVSLYLFRTDENDRSMNRNYQKELDKIIEKITAAAENADSTVCKAGKDVMPTLFLHSCCAPCSSYVLEYLRKYFRITVFYYNPNITEDEEYRKRVTEQKRLIAAYNAECQGYPIEIIEGVYEPERFFETSKGLEQCPEGGERCFKCYELRLQETAKRAQAGKYDFFTTTLSISPLKNAAKLNEIGERLAQEYGVRWLPSDFKKKDGYKRSIELSKEYDLYRQDYCGCVYSRRQ